MRVTNQFDLRCITKNSPLKVVVSGGKLVLRICVVCSGFASWLGGAEVTLNQLSRYWVKHGHEVYIISGWGKKSGQENVKMIRLPFISREYFDKMPLVSKILFFFPTSTFRER